MLQKFTILISFFFLWSCGTPTKVVDENIPEWSKNRPKTDFYYIGIAKVDKAVHPSDYQETAKKIALSDLASEISIKIESNSLLSSYEDNNSFNSDYQQYIKTETSKELSGFEMVENYETKKTYQVYYRLSKSKWSRIQAQRKTDAAKKSFHWYEQAKTEKEQLNYTIAIQYYLNSLLEIKKYWSESVQFRNGEDVIQLDRAIKSELLELLSSINIELNTRTILLNSNNNFSQTVGVSIVNQKGELIKDIPLVAKYKKSTIPYRKSFFSLKEEVGVKIEEVDFGRSGSNFIVEIEKNKILKISSENKRMLSFINDAFNVKPSTIPIKIELPKVYISTSSKEKYQSEYMHFLKDGISAALNKQNIEIANSLNESDYNLIITAHETKGPNEQKFKYIYLSYNIEVKDIKSGKLIFTQSYPKIKGTDSTFEKAKEKAYSKSAEEFKHQYAKKLIQGLLN